MSRPACPGLQPAPAKDRPCLFLELLHGRGTACSLPGTTASPCRLRADTESTFHRSVDWSSLQTRWAEGEGWGGGLGQRCPGPAPRGPQAQMTPMCSRPPRARCFNPGPQPHGCPSLGPSLLLVKQGRGSQTRQTEREDGFWSPANLGSNTDH